MTDLTPWNNPDFVRHPQVLYPDELGERVRFAEQYQTIEYYEKLARQAVRKANWKRRVRAFCIAVAVFAVVVFAGQFVRVFL